MFTYALHVKLQNTYLWSWIILNTFSETITSECLPANLRHSDFIVIIRSNSNRIKKIVRPNLFVLIRLSNALIHDTIFMPFVYPYVWCAQHVRFSVQRFFETLHSLITLLRCSYIGFMSVIATAPRAVVFTSKNNLIAASMLASVVYIAQLIFAAN